jgi:hypothetical protein
MTRTLVVSRLQGKGLAVVAVLAVASPAWAQQQQDQPPQDQPAASGATAQATSDAFERACVDLIHGKTPKGQRATDALRDACASLMKARTEDRAQAERQRQARAAMRAQASAQGSGSTQGGQSAAQVEPGESALAAFVAAGNELVGARPRGMMGMRRSGEPFSSTLVTNPVGWFTGIGVNAELARPFREKFSWTAGAHYSQANATDTSLYTLGVLAGTDWFILGQNNEGFRVGPRLDYSFGREATPGGNETRQRLGLAGELGYNFIATNGITGEAAFGVGGRIAGDKNTELSSSVGGDFGPYVKLGVGYSW